MARLDGLGTVDKKWLLIGTLVGIVVAYKVLPRFAPGIKAKLGG